MSQFGRVMAIVVTYGLIFSLSMGAQAKPSSLEALAREIHWQSDWLYGQIQVEAWPGDYEQSLALTRTADTVYLAQTWLHFVRQDEYDSNKHYEHFNRLERKFFWARSAIRRGGFSNSVLVDLERLEALMNEAQDYYNRNYSH